MYEEYLFSEKILFFGFAACLFLMITSAFLLSENRRAFLFVIGLIFFLAGGFVSYAKRPIYMDEMSNAISKIDETYAVRIKLSSPIAEELYICVADFTKNKKQNEILFQEIEKYKIAKTKSGKELIKADPIAAACLGRILSREGNDLLKLQIAE